MTEDQIERLVERKIDRLDRAYLAGKVTTKEYEARIEEIVSQAEGFYNRARS